nr:hypothetical protein [Sicyoidochytrium minutum DNA virus]
MSSKFSESEIDALYNKSYGIVAAVFFLFILVVIRQGGSSWFSFNLHPNWVPDIASFIVLFFTFLAVVFTLAIPMSYAITQTSALVADKNGFSSLLTGLALVGSAMVFFWVVVSVLLYRYFQRVSITNADPGSPSSRLYSLLWIPFSIIWGYALVLGLMYWAPITYAAY